MDSFLIPFVNHWCSKFFSGQRSSLKAASFISFMTVDYDDFRAKVTYIHYNLSTRLLSSMFLKTELFSARDTEWGQAAFSNLVKRGFENAVWSWVTTRDWQKGRARKAGRTGAVTIPSEWCPPNLTGRWTGSGGAPRHVQAWAESLSEHTGTRRRGPLPSTLCREWSMAELLIARCKRWWKWIMCISLKTSAWFTR